MDYKPCTFLLNKGKGLEFSDLFSQGSV